MSDLDINSLLDSTLDDLADLPSFKPFAAGAHEAKLTLSTKEIAGHPTVEASLVLVTTLEYADPEEGEANPNKEGDTASTAFFLDSEIGAGKFKEFMTPLCEALGSQHLGTVVEQVTDMDVVVVTGIRTDKKDKTKIYLDIKEVQVV